MNCIETKENIEALLDGELDDAQKDAVEHHLWICDDCRDLREQRMSLAGLLQQVSLAALPPAALDRRVMRSFQNHHAPKRAWWRQMLFGSLAVPKPAFALLLILASAGFWAAFRLGKMSSPATPAEKLPSIAVNESPTLPPAEKTVQTVRIEVPVVKEKIVTRTVYVREQKDVKNEKDIIPVNPKQNKLPLYNSSVADNGYFTDVSLKGFQPSAEMGAKIIKEVKKENEEK